MAEKTQRLFQKGIREFLGVDSTYVETGPVTVEWKGETLWEIAGRAYGDPTQYVRIKNANPQLKNADKVKAGTKILWTIFRLRMSGATRARGQS